MKKLGISLEDIDYFIISHGHKDHIGGLINILDRIEPSKIYLSQESLNSFSFNIFGIHKNIGLEKIHLEAIKKMELNRIKDKCYYIDEQIILFRGDPIKKSNFYKKSGEKDDFYDEIQLIISENDKLNIVTGCSHLGIENIVSSITKKFPNKKINSILGGLHTRSYFLSPWKLFSLIKFLKNSNINYYYLGHCTGSIVTNILKKTIRNVFDLKTGTIIKF